MSIVRVRDCAIIRAIKSFVCVTAQIIRAIGYQVELSAKLVSLKFYYAAWKSSLSVLLSYLVDGNSAFKVVDFKRRFARILVSPSFSVISFVHNDWLASCIKNEVSVCWVHCEVYACNEMYFSIRPGFLNLGCWNQFQGVLGKVTYVAVKGKRNAFRQRC